MYLTRLSPEDAFSQSVMLCVCSRSNEFQLAQVITVWLEGSILGTLLHYLVDKDPVTQVAFYALTASWRCQYDDPIMQAYKRSVEELIHFVDTKMLPPETASRLFKHVEFLVYFFILRANWQIAMSDQS